MKQAVEFQSDGTTCRGYVFSPSPETSNGAGIVVAHGLAGTIDAGILEYGEGFAAAGFHALVFDYRGFGESDGDIRQHVSVPMQRADWRAAIATLRAHDGVDAARIGLWGMSFSGGHVFYLAHEDAAIKAIVSQVPMVDSHLAMTVGTYQRGGPQSAALGAIVQGEMKNMLLRRPSKMIAVAPAEGAGPPVLGAEEAAIYPKIVGPSWRNEITARSFITGKLADNNATELSDTFTTPVLLQLAEDDKCVSNEAMVNMARRLGPVAQLKKYQGGHFEFLKEPGRPLALGDASQFFTEQLAS